MAEVRLLALGRAVPEHRYTQAELYAFNPWDDTPLTDRLFLGSPVATRSLFVPPTFYGRPRSLTETNAAWREGALRLGGEALEEGLARAGMKATDVGHIGVTTVTGYTTPGLDLLLTKAHGLRNDIQRTHFNNIGCHAAIPLLRSVSDHVSCRSERVGVAIAVEVCSACFAPDDDPQNLVALSLFADGAACAVVGTHGDGPAIIDFESVFDLDHIDALGFDLSHTGFRIVLDPSIPERVAHGVQIAVGRLLERHGLTQDDISAWGLHPGGSRILDAVQRGLGLSDTAMRPSRRVLRNYGNMSSPSVLFVLADILAEGRVPTGGWVVLAAFGPGLGVETALLRV